LEKYGFTPVPASGFMLDPNGGNGGLSPNNTNNNSGLRAAPGYWEGLSTYGSMVLDGKLSLGDGLDYAWNDTKVGLRDALIPNLHAARRSGAPMTVSSTVIGLGKSAYGAVLDVSGMMYEGFRASNPLLRIALDITGVSSRVREANQALQPTFSASERWGRALFEGVSLISTIASGAGLSMRAGGLQSVVANTGAGLRTSTVVSADRAEAFLLKNDFPAARAKDFVDSFDGPITARLVRSNEDWLRYTDVANSKGSFLTKTQFATPDEAVRGLYLLPEFNNNATLVQGVSSTGRSIVLEGAVKNGGPGIRQTLVIDRDKFYFGTGKGY